MSCLRLSAAVGVAAVLLCAYSWSPAFFTQNAALANWAPLTRELSGWHHHESHHAALQGPQHQARPISDQAWNIHHHLGGNGPWISNADENNNDIRTPTGCEIEQVHILSRHAERYPTMKAGGRLLDLLIRLHRSDVMMVGDLEFANDWKFFTSDPMRDFDQLTRSGPYAGTLAAFTTGVRMRTRYGHLLDQHFSTRQLLNLWAGDSQRVIETAEHFAAGLLGLGWKSRAILHIVPEEPSTGGDTLTPGKACLNYIQDVQNGRESGYAALATFTDTAFAATAARLSKFIKTTSSQNFKLSTVDVYAMQELCGFEILTRGSSPWCDIFTKDEWERFAYARDLLHFYRAGPGGKYSRTMGALYLNTTAELMLQGPEAGPLFFSFVHDGDIVPVLSALRIFHDEGDLLPLTEIKHDRKWKTSKVTPMGGRIIFERLRCWVDIASGVSRPSEAFVRVNINDGVVSLPGCDIGSGLCSLEQFVAQLRKNQEDVGNFRSVCGLDDSLPERISFLHQRFVSHA